jgi:peptidyl-prolyl cis-trans isomerase SurA
MVKKWLKHRTGATCILFSLIIFGCSPKEHDTIVATIGGDPITLVEFEKLYLKSYGNKDTVQNSTPEEREKFLDLMTKYKLKLADAYAKGLDKDPAVVAEVNQYRGSLAQSFLTEHDVVDPGVREMYDRRSEEIRASHILLSLTPKASREDSSAAYRQAYEIIAAAKSGLPFDSLALEFSKDPSVKRNHGDLYYFTSGQMVREFEDAVYGMKSGQISNHPVRTQYGLHVIKVVDRKPSAGETHCAHIMIRFAKQDPTPEDTLAAFKAISLIKDSLAAGYDFAELAKRNSGDPGSAPRGGDLGWFERRRWILPFDEIAFTLKPGQVSGVVRTVYGYHIIKCLETRPQKSFAESRKDLEQAYKQTRFQEDYAKYLDQLKAHVGFSIDSSVVRRFVQALDSTKSVRDSGWSVAATGNLGSLPVFMIAHRPVTVDSLVALMKARPDLGNLSLHSAEVHSAVDKIGEQLVFEARAKTLEEESPEFAGIMKEYKEGILLYEIEQNSVWKRVTVNDSLLQRYFESHRKDFTFPDRLDISEIHVIRDSVANALYDELRQGKISMKEAVEADSIRMAQPARCEAAFSRRSARPTKETLAFLSSVGPEMQNDGATRVQIIAHADTASASSKRLSNLRVTALEQHLQKKYSIASNRISWVIRPVPAGSSPDTVTIDLINRRPNILGGVISGLYPVDTDARTTKADSLEAGSYVQPFLYKGSYAIVRLNRKERAREKDFDEASTEVSSAFQEYESKRLESEWLDGLRKKYPVVEHKESLKRAFITASK